MPIFKKTKCRMKWCYSPLRHEDGTCEKTCTYNTIHVQTNGDRIRAMTDEELAEFCDEIGVCPKDRYISDHLAEPTKEECIACWLEWLKKEEKDE